MPSAPSKSDLVEAIRAERTQLADLVETFSPEEWATSSACPGWKIGELVNHLLIGDRGTWRAGLALFRFKSPFTWIEESQRGGAARGPADAATRLRSPRLSITARFPGRLGARANLGEMLIHVEDVLRPLGRTRPAPPRPDTALASLGLVARWQFRKLKTRGTLALVTPDGPVLTVRSGFPLPRIRSGPKTTGTAPADARVEGDVVELLQFLTGRTTDIRIEGDSVLAERMRANMPGL